MRTFSRVKYVSLSEVRTYKEESVVHDLYSGTRKLERFIFLELIPATCVILRRKTDRRKGLMAATLVCSSNGESDSWKLYQISLKFLISVNMLRMVVKLGPIRAILEDTTIIQNPDKAIFKGKRMRLTNLVIWRLLRRAARCRAFSPCSSTACSCPETPAIAVRQEEWPLFTACSDDSQQAARILSSILFAHSL